jgi:hypothetical protein
MIAALYVAKGGPYYDLEGVTPYSENEDARIYQGPHPVVAHPECQRYGRFWKGQPGNIKKGKIERMGDDQGCFKCALYDVRRWGGVLEHPEGSHAWKMFGLAKPPRQGGWIKADDFGGWTCRVEQGQYGHYCPKGTWLYAVNCDLPELKWGVHPTTDDDFRRLAPHHVEKHGIEWCRRAGIMAMLGGGKNAGPRIHTPPEFRDVLIAMARSAAKTEAA